jgi:hypothetical protein
MTQTLSHMPQLTELLLGHTLRISREEFTSTVTLPHLLSATFDEDYTEAQFLLQNIDAPNLLDLNLIREYDPESNSKLTPVQTLSWRLVHSCIRNTIGPSTSIVMHLAEDGKHWVKVQPPGNSKDGLLLLPTKDPVSCEDALSFGLQLVKLLHIDSFNLSTSFQGTYPALSFWRSHLTGPDVDLTALVLQGYCPKELLEALTGGSVDCREESLDAPTERDITILPLPSLAGFALSDLTFTDPDLEALKLCLESRARSGASLRILMDDCHGVDQSYLQSLVDAEVVISAEWNS